MSSMENWWNMSGSAMRSYFHCWNIAKQSKIMILKSSLSSIKSNLILVWECRRVFSTFVRLKTQVKKTKMMEHSYAYGRCCQEWFNIFIHVRCSLFSVQCLAMNQSFWKSFGKFYVTHKQSCVIFGLIIWKKRMKTLYTFEMFVRWL